MHTSKKSRARAGELKTAHGKIATPFFMPIATRGAVKTLAASDMRELGAQILLSNTYHLFVRPGMEVIKKAGGLHKFMGWDGPILTDSGGYQIFSLAAKNKSEIRNPKSETNDEADYDVRITKDGAEFIDRLSGRKDLLTPERVVEIQKTMGVDIAMVLDVCAPYPISHVGAKEAMEMTSEWARRSIEHRAKSIGYKVRNSKPYALSHTQLLFGIVQGSVYKDLRQQSAREITELGFDGYAIGGVAVGENARQKRQVVDWVVPNLPEDKPRYLMGLGQPEEIVWAVQSGIDMFDCVLPTRNARHGNLYVRKSSQSSVHSSQFYNVMHITNEKYRADFKPVDPHCSCFTCTHHSRAYLRHLFKTAEPLAARLATIHNVKFYLDLMAGLRDAIACGRL